MLFRIPSLFLKLERQKRKLKLLIVHLYFNQAQGKTPSWKTEIVLTYFDESTMNVTSLEEDTMSNDYMGSGTVDLKKLKASGLLEIKI